MASLPLHIWSPLLLFLILLFTFLLVIKKKLNSKHLAPGPPGLPIIGNFHQLGALPHQSLWKLSRKYGPVMQLQFGQVPTVIISSAEAAKELLKTNDLNCCSRPPLAGTGRLSYDFLDVAFAPYGDHWRGMRKIFVLELVSARRIQSFQSTREQEVGYFIDSISKASSSSSPVDLSEEIMSLSTDIICRLCFGKSLEERGFDNKKIHKMLLEGAAMLGSFSAADFFPYFGSIIDRLTGLHTRLEKIFQEFDFIYEKLIDDHIQKGKEKDGQEDILDVLLNLERNQTDSASIQVSQNRIKAIIMNIFTGGVDAWAITVVWAMAEMIRNPRVMKKAQEEIRTMIGDKRKVSESDIDKFEYLKLIIKETVRLHPAGPLLIPREAMSEFSISGYKIHPKTRIQVNAWAIGRDPKSWENPEEFFPERFVESSIDFRGQSYELLPFGSGRRSCPGMNMAVVLVELVLANLLFCFDWKLPYNMNVADISMEEECGITTCKKEALLLVPIKYELPSEKQQDYIYDYVTLAFINYIIK